MKLTTCFAKYFPSFTCRKSAHARLVIATENKKNVRYLALRCYSAQTLFSKLNKNHEHNT
ncbi:hypothetical protein D1174_18975 [Enterobacter cloacae]|nr:hypothetical protein D1177_06470 [Enterobacter cloacae]KAA3580328.1 hypothetical protein D1176_00075 [Enterobacter cloacae]KAA3586379.1 hypothetical protein D1174_18975 [Enterobacter cloacae]KAA3593589.1 hypothetical protein D1175_00075 [Enterobacter cloacae]QCC94089.1 hypothetical protein E7735_09405 [Enterobacter cloacae]